MGSRRTTARASFGSGGSSSGEDMRANSRPNGCSYISNVRPENRSTLCSMMAQLTEETQPFFELTLKSKAVSEKCNVKFSCVVTGNPTPQITWYKDDVQLDRYCGLPKYEIFRNGKNYSLHIYNCTVEDAAIYQASAGNTKGIVSCSGVLEVGEMNEYKIHQRYFAKIKQKADNKRKEVEGKENQEPIRTISPDRTARKRRSTMDTFLSTPSSLEDEGNEESTQALTEQTEARLHEATVKEMEEKSVPITNGTVSAVSNGQTVSENGNKSGTNIYDSAPKSFTAQQTKTPFVRKKIKMSNSAQEERAPEERSAKEENITPVVLACTESVQVKGISEEFMEVENTVSSSVVDSVPRKMAQGHQKSEEVLLADRHSKNERVPVEVAVPSKKEQLCLLKKEQLTASVPPAAPTSTGHNMSGAKGKKDAKLEKEAGRNNPEKILEMQKRIPPITSKQRQSSPTAPPRKHRNLVKGNMSKIEPQTVMDVDKKSNTSIAGSLARKEIEAKKAPCESTSASPQRPCEQAGDKLSLKETGPCQKNMSVSQPAQLNEVKQVHTKRNRNDAPVSLELPHNRMDMPRPQKTPSERKTTTDDIQSPSALCGVQVAIGKMSQDTWDHSRGSNESHTVLISDVQKSPFKSTGGGENTSGCNVSSSVEQSQADTAIKTVEGTEIQVDEKVKHNEAGKSLAQSDSMAPNEKIDEMETESPTLHMTEHTGTEKPKDAADKDSDVREGDVTNKETEKNEHLLKMAEETSSALQNLKSFIIEPAIQLLTKNPGKANISELQLKDLQEIQEPVTKIISVAELLRSQLKALDATLANSVTTIPVHASVLQDAATAVTEKCEEIKEKDRKPEVEKSMSDRKSETHDDQPLRTIKETLTEIYNLLNEENQGELSPPVQALQKPLSTPPISAVDTGTTKETTGLHGSDNKYNESVMDIAASTLVPLKECPVVSVCGSENDKHEFPLSTSNDELTKRLASGTVGLETGTPLAVKPIKASSQESIITVLENAKGKPVDGKDMGVIPKLTAESKPDRQTNKTITETEEHNTTNCSLQSEKVPTKSELGTDTKENNINIIQQDSSMVKEVRRTNSLGSLTPQASPLLKRRDCVSPIPSATPQELASGARRKILVPKTKSEEASEATAPVDIQTQKKEGPAESNRLSVSPVTLSTSPSMSRRSPLLQIPGEQTPPTERRSPLVSRRKMVSETPAPSQPPKEEIHTQKTDGKPAEKDKHDPFKAPQVIRKIRGESFADASGHLKLWCQFFNILSDSTIKWYKNEEGIAQIQRNAGDETQVNLAIVQASCIDSGVYGCTITNEYGTDSTDFLLSADVLAGMSLREDLGVGEEIEMTPMIFSKGVADSGAWGNKFFGRIMMQESHIGKGCSHKVWRAKVIYGLEPVFESGNTCIIKGLNPIAYGGKAESCLIDRNLDVVKQECKIQNLVREYCKIFSAEARVIENFGPLLVVLPVYLMYRPANTVPYATVEADLTGVYQKYSVLDGAGRLDTKSGSEAGQKCCALQHWIFQWTSGNLLISRIEGVDTKITNVGISIKSTGHHGLPVEGNPKVFEQFVSQHQCNYFCGLLSLRSLKIMDSLLTPTKPKGTKSPLLQRKMAGGSNSPQTGRKADGSPRLPRKTEQNGRNTPTKQKAADVPIAVKVE
ncbi:alpha-protein kinase 3-like [Notothenia coriiceps]|uniref:non-specific serine/threonine protein kinase n=1 Tax=Notothenia coriiceps TaxID=8208 RepID=A0A6I9N7X3_9TELE|nr:PREDICTED: alpha-protein kinase 3-like [Notothenia coriiceps]XP_010771503.1 PREDICTED: alpha-protein kinase 3-like [Notothenia coriiceps]